ncbi:unnamed protein product [Nezara viridula]|uniref:Uncharacterized protein n=1 Tax=Nezara viridula TaxID=85310 RepID=A0A9P0HFQ1_NEZVI|nr:unnamed protein product [Nezara viridula]
MLPEDIRGDAEMDVDVEKESLIRNNECVFRIEHRKTGRSAVETPGEEGLWENGGRCPRLLGGGGEGLLLQFGENEDEDDDNTTGQYLL